MPTYKVTDPASGKTIKLTGDSPPTEQELSDIFSSIGSGGSPASSAPRKAAIDTVPEWGRKNPNLYGVAGAAYETVNPVLEALGLVGGGLLGTPAGPAGNVGGAALGYAGAKKINKLAGGLLGVEQPESIPQGFINTAQDVKEGAIMEMGGQALNEGVGLLWNALPKRTEYWLMESALKPSTTIKQVVRDKVADTMMRERIPASSGGLKKVQTGIKEINKEIDDIVKAADAKGTTVSNDAIVSKLQELKNKYAQSKALPDEYIKEVDDVIGQFEARSSQIPVAQAQEFKKDLYKELNGFYEKFQKYGQVKPEEWGEVRAKLASGLREELGNMIPELNSLNAKDKALIEVNKVLERAVNRTNNQNLLKLIGSVIGSGGDGFSIKRYLGAVIADHPWVKSRVAIAIRKARLKPDRAMTRAVGAVSAKEPFEGEQQGNENE